MLKFGKVDFATSLSPTSAFPLDGRTVFSTLEEAQTAAASAKEVGSTESRYHHGMKLLVASTNTWYKITTSGTLERENAGGTGGIVWRGEYSTENPYDINDAVYFEGSSYVCIKAHGASTAQLPTNNEYWDLLAKKGADGGGISFTIDETLNLSEDNVLGVNCETSMVDGSSLPITSEAVYNVVGDINSLLTKI